MGVLLDLGNSFSCFNCQCREVLAELKAAGASWVQFDEPTLVMDLDSHELKAFTDAYGQLEESLSGLNVIVETFFADVSPDAYKSVVFS